MIIAAVEIFAGTILQLVVALLRLIGNVLPVEVGEAMQWFVNQTMLLNGIFPVDTLLTAIMTVFGLVSAWWSLKIILFAVNLIPGVKLRMPGRAHIDIDATAMRK